MSESAQAACPFDHSPEEGRLLPAACLLIKCGVVYGKRLHCGPSVICLRAGGGERLALFMSLHVYVKKQATWSEVGLLSGPGLRNGLASCVPGSGSPQIYTAKAEPQARNTRSCLR